MWLRHVGRIALHICAWILLAEIYVSNATTPLLTFRWRSLNQSVGTSCTKSLKQQLNVHVNEALVDILMYKWRGEINAPIKEICENSLLLTGSGFLESSRDKICTNLHNSEELEFIRAYYSLMDVTASLKAISKIPAKYNYQNLSEGATKRGYYEQGQTLVLSSGPSIFEIADAVYRLSVQKGWTYIVIMIEAEDGAVRLSQALQSMAKADQRVCFPLVITFTTGNATAAAKALRTFAYPEIPRLTVVYSGSGTTFLSLWDLVTGSDPLSPLSVDSEKRYQFVLVGDALGSFYRATDSARRRNFGLGTIFVFPGVLDRDPSSDKLAILLRNISGSPESMGEFLSLTGTWSRLQSLRISTSLVCKWDNIGDMCYTQALMYDFQLLSFLPLFGSEPEFTPDGIERLRLKIVSLTDLRSSVPFVDAFLQQNFTHYSLARGLSHVSRGFWQPIVKVYQSQLDSKSAEATLVKLGELRVKQAGSADQSYEWDLSRTPELYQFGGGSADHLPVKADSDSSVCPRNCPECLRYQSKQIVEFKPGDIYLGAVLPIFDHGTDEFDCSDPELFSSASEWSTAFRFVVSLANWGSQMTELPPGMEPNLVDQSFLLGLKDLVSKVNEGRSSRLRWGYVIVDSCSSAPYLASHLWLLLDGRLEPYTNVNYKHFAGFVGDLSSTQTMAASQVLKQFNLPIISHGSTSTALGNVFQYPFTMRTVSSDNEIVEAMLSSVKHYNVDVITVVHTTNAYGLSLKNAMVTKASRDEICIARLLVFDCEIFDQNCKRTVALQMRNSGTRYVTFLSDVQDFKKFVDYPQVESDLEFLTIFATETIDATTFTGKNNLGVGTTMVQLVSAPEPGFLKYLNYTLTRMPANSNNLTQWDRLHFEMVHQCYLTDSFVRNAKYTQPCVPSIVASHQVNQLESRSVFVMTATQTLILGCLTAINYLCSVVTPEPACPVFFKGDDVTQLQRANLIMYGQVTATGTTAQRFSGTFEGKTWSFQKIFENRMGRTPMRLMQFRKIGSAEYEFVQFGLFDGVNSSLFSASAEQLFAHERQATSSLKKVCRRWTDCDKPKCVNIISPPVTGCSGPGCTTPAPSPPSSSPPSLGLLGLLFLPGVLIGVLIFWFLRRLLPQFGSNESDYAYADRSQTELAEASSIGRGNTDSCYYDTTDGTGNSTGTANRPLPEPSVQ